MTDNEDYRRGYRDGWSDAMKTQKSPAPMVPPEWGVSTGCSVCGMTGLTNYVCTNPNCPTLPTCTCGAGI